MLRIISQDETSKPAKNVVILYKNLENMIQSYETRNQYFQYRFTIKNLYYQHFFV